MLKKIIFCSIALINLLNATEVTTQPLVNSPEQNGKLEFEKVLKNLQEKKATEGATLPIPPLDSITTNPSSDFNVIGTLKIGSNKYCYLIVDSNRVIKATEGMTIKNKKIEEINDYGITISDKSKNNSYLPILTSQIQESDIVFSNRDNNKKQ